MPGITLGWLFGVWLFQQQAALWSPVAFCALLVPVVLGMGLLRITYFHSFKKIICYMVCVLSVAGLGFVYAQGRACWRLQDSLPATCERQVIAVQARIVGVPARDPRGQHVDALIEHAFSSHCPLPARVHLSLYQQQYRQAPPESVAALPVLHAGERWQFSVRLKRPHATRNPHGFDYAAWCLSNDIRAVGNIVSKAPMQRLDALVWQPHTLIARWREHVGSRISHVLGNTPQSAVLRALVIGDDSQISRADWQLFVDTGINHLVSISGLHITMLAALGYGLMGWLWRRQPHWALRIPSRQAASMGGAIVAILYSALAGFSIPTQRTLYMLLTVAAMLNLRRRLPFSWILCVALWLVLLLDPWAVLAPGFWLSFGAVAVLAFAMGGRLKSPPWWVAAGKTQWAVTVAFLPLLMAMFNQVSLVSPLANALAIPLISLAVVPVAIAGALLPLDVLLDCAASVLDACMQALQWLQHLPWAVWYQATPPTWAWLLALLGVGILLMPRGWPLRWAGLCLCLPVCMPQAPVLQSGQMQVTVLDVGQGLSVLVQTAHHTLLYDAGPAYSADSDAGQRIVLPYLRHLGIHQLDIAMISHDDSDHVGGMASVLTGVPARSILSSLTPEAVFFKQMADVRHMRGRMPVHQPCLAGMRWQWEGVQFQLLSPDAALLMTAKDNDKSCVLQILSAHGSLLLTGDIEKLAERHLLQTSPAVLAATVVTMPHHGSKTSSSQAFVNAVSPRLAIATAGYLNRFGHPKREILARYQAAGAQVLRSDMDGAVLLSFLSGETPAVQRWRLSEPHYWETSAL